MATTANGVYIGAGANDNADGYSGNVIIGQGAQGTATHQVRIGNTSVTSCFIGQTTIPCGASAITVSQNVASGTSALGTTAIASLACATVVTTAATGVATTDAIDWSFNAAPDATYNGLTIKPYVTSGNVNFLVCNPTAGSITPAAATLNWRVAR
jgi:hypothetical protein